MLLSVPAQLRSFMSPLIIFPVFGGLAAIVQGSDASFDLLNYHLFNGWSLFQTKNTDFLPTSIWTFFPSVLDAIYYSLWQTLPDVYVTFLVGSFQGVIGIFVFTLVRDLCPPGKNRLFLSYSAAFMCLTSPLFFSQLGNSMADATLAVLEFYLISKVIRKRFLNENFSCIRNGLILGVTLGLKPAHIAAGIVIGFLFLFSCSFINATRFTLASISGFLLISLPYWVKATMSVGFPFFPYVNNSLSASYLSNMGFFQGNESWKVTSLLDFFKTIIYPGGNPNVNSETPFFDVTIPYALAVLAIILIRGFLYRNLRGVFSSHSFQLITISLAIMSLNLLTLTGVRFSTVSYTIAIVGICLCISKAEKNRLQYSFVSFASIFWFIFILATSSSISNLNLQANQSIYPNWGRIGVEYTQKTQDKFKKPSQIDPGSVVILGQEQTSIVGPLWSDPSLQFIGLQYYSLGEKSRKNVAAILDQATAEKKQKVFLVSLLSNLEFVTNQLYAIDKNLKIIDCEPVQSPYDREYRETKLCRIVLK
jgi:hypothetical protein